MQFFPLALTQTFSYFDNAEIEEDAISNDIIKRAAERTKEDDEFKDERKCLLAQMMRIAIFNMPNVSS